MVDLRFCYRHPTDVTKRKCFHCKRAICLNCQIKIDHHLFCGNGCYQEFAGTTLAKPQNEYKRYATYATLVVLIIGFVYFALLADAFYSGGKTTIAPANAEIAPSLPLNIDEKPASQILIQRPSNGMKSPSQTVEVEGKAPANSVVALYLNGTLTDSTVAAGGFYRFPSVLLTKSSNVMQTRFHADNGSSDASSAIMVFYKHSIPAVSDDLSFFQNSPNNISRGRADRREIVMTFDGGSEANSCDAILQALQEANVRSTFFLTGEFIEKFPDCTLRIAARHEVGNHTYSHTHFTTYAENLQPKTAAYVTREAFQDQLRKTEELFQQVTGRRMAPVWRAPYGEQNVEIRRWAAELGYVHVAWTANPKTQQNMDSLDWVPNANFPGYFPALLMKDRILSFGQNETEQANGSIVLMHLGSQRDPSDRLDKWLPEIINTFRDRGYEFITATELIDRQDPMAKNSSNPSGESR